AADSLARTITVRPESSTILYSGDTFSVSETLFVPVHEAGAIVLIEVETSEPLEVEASFHRDFQLEWPAALGGTYITWDPDLHAFFLGEEQRKFAAFVGSPSATDHREEFSTNYASSRENSFRLGVTNKGRDRKVIVIAASLQNRDEAVTAYRHLSASYADLQKESAAYYRDYLNKTVDLELPDRDLQQAYDWSRISMVQGLVTNPFLGTGLIAGYRTSGDSQRPGFAWFFGRDSLWTSLALNSEGDFTTTRTAIEFLSKYQRADGKIPHEISQGASFVPWFTNYPYGYASADATPLYIIAMNDYVVRSGDVDFAKTKWESVWKAYQFLRSTYDAQGFPQNLGFGHGWVEGGPLLPVKTELYQSGLGAEALRALSNLAHLIGKEDVSKELDQGFTRMKPLLNQTFWLPEKNIFAFALDKDNRRVDIPSVLATVPMWFDLLDEDKSEAMLNQLADYEHQTDWGMRIISSQDPKYNAGGYHFGSVWPLFTGWASVGEYRYHRALPAYSNLRANALLALDGSLGHVTEVVSGDYYQPISTSSPHQIWSAAMVVSPILRGMLGLETNAISHRMVFAPHFPADWTSFRARNLRVGNSSVDMTYRKTPENITLEVKRTGAGDFTLEFAPAFSLRTSILGAELNGRPIAIHTLTNAVDQHAGVQFPVTGNANTLRIRIRNDFGLVLSSSLPALGSSSRGLRIVSESWSRQHDTLSLDVSGVSGDEYELGLWNSSQIESLDGAELVKTTLDQAVARIQFPASSSESYARKKITFHFSTRH
ncbi:MAG TPA: amylo-alpha-1,6-glucosidase, partial [Terriglobales bacterium]|nr:amylo-alpha-1,6-glucosidase [Terriglobales bacterium]